jgi:2-polyprenyl-6-methoxyphenol hydroxylase-like FAD-dependent oxidoreductase
VLGLKLAELGFRVQVFDGQPQYPDRFRAEKLEKDQYEALEKLGLIELVRPAQQSFISHVHELSVKGERLVPCSKHRGMDYQKTVNSFRDELERRGLLTIRKVSAVNDMDDRCELVFDDNSSVQASLAIMATGGSKVVRESLGLRVKQRPNDMLSTTFGFYVEPTSTERFPFDAFNVRPDQFVRGLHYVTFFPVGSRTRVNVFTCWRPASSEARAFRKAPLDALNELFPFLEDRVGTFRISSPVQVYTTRYYRQDCSQLRRTVLVGDEFQSVAPATGMGITKCLTDSLALLKTVRRFAGAKPGSIELRDYYASPDKVFVDDSARAQWRWANESATSQSLKTNLKKIKRRFESTIHAFAP